MLANYSVQYAFLLMAYLLVHDITIHSQIVTNFICDNIARKSNVKHYSDICNFNIILLISRLFSCMQSMVSFCYFFFLRMLKFEAEI